MVDHTESGPVLQLDGDIDMAVVAAFEALASDDIAALRNDTRLSVNASAVTFMDSSGLAFLVRMTLPTRADGGRPALHSPSKSVRKILDLTGLHGLFDVKL
ncbi:STAS domain-containing protein [Blastococcus sp. LR1]|uniref:STAS domain-containing protein n=1 Tax=Blastococcus sp. LR1 TaxID=2877000 RepID=UPI001CCBDA91|nr:STAS domain-containing protein [Blastococcus sp. LR1]MCA0143984.1 STAS domain-containing protein [Blastococcus sp. LR1]